MFTFSLKSLIPIFSPPLFGNQLVIFGSMAAASPAIKVPVATGPARLHAIPPSNGAKLKQLRGAIQISHSLFKIKYFFRCMIIKIESKIYEF